MRSSRPCIRGEGVKDSTDKMTKSGNTARNPYPSRGDTSVKRGRAIAPVDHGNLPNTCLAWALTSDLVHSSANSRAGSNGSTDSNILWS
jgi:hypothetical protein